MLKGKDVYLAPLTAADLQQMFDWINDREQVLFNAAYKPTSEARHQEWFKSVQNRNDMVIFTVRQVETNALVGSCQLRNLNFVHRIGELQIRIGSVEQRGHGYGTQAVNLVLQHAFKDLNLQRVYLHVFATNARAIRVYEKAGFVREGLLRRGAYIDGNYVDVVVMGILKEEYLHRAETAS